jgi:hypothetical protein
MLKEREGNNDFVCRNRKELFYWVPSCTVQTRREMKDPWCLEMLCQAKSERHVSFLRPKLLTELQHMLEHPNPIFHYVILRFKRTKLMKLLIL